MDYFPIDQLPPLAFPHNEKAIRLCADLHRDEWAIHDSFRRLEEGAESTDGARARTGAGQGAEMLSDSLIGFVSESIPLVARLWLADVRSNHTTASYLRLDPDMLLAECTTSLQQLGRWLEGESTEEQIKQSFRDLGARRQVSGSPAARAAVGHHAAQEADLGPRPLSGRVAAPDGDVPGDGAAEPLRGVLRPGHVPLGPGLRRRVSRPGFIVGTGAGLLPAFTRSSAISFQETVPGPSHHV